MAETTKRCFIDTNIWLYAFVASDRQSQYETAKATVNRPEIFISTQVINETCVNLLKKAQWKEITVRELIVAFYEKYGVVDLDQTILQKASDLRERYSLSFWDSMIVASALNSGCEVLFTEDMQAGLVIDNRLTIVNPFIIR